MLPTVVPPQPAPSTSPCLRAFAHLWPNNSRAVLDGAIGAESTGRSSADCGHGPRADQWHSTRPCSEGEAHHDHLGIILIVVGLIFNISILTTIGVILLVIGLILTILGAMGRAVGGRKTYY